MDQKTGGMLKVTKVVLKAEPVQLQPVHSPLMLTPRVLFQPKNQESPSNCQCENENVYESIRKIDQQERVVPDFSILDRMLAHYDRKLKSFGRHYQRELAREFSYPVEYENSFSSETSTPDDETPSERESEKEDWQREFEAKFGNERRQRNFV